MVLDKMEKENDIKKLTNSELELLRGEIREFLINTLSITGGHLASNLGTVELTMALHLVFDLPKDKIIWDVGHQSYTHKILTGRKDEFVTLRQYGGLSGFPNRAESPCDVFETGHSTTSISAGLGLAWTRELQKEDYKVISVIGDGALTGGMAYEAINNAAELKKNFIIVLNDNNMSISENVGGMSVQLSKLRTSNSYTELKEGVQTSLEKIPIYGDKIVAKIRKTKSGIKQLVDGSNTLVANNAQLNSGASQLADGTNQIVSGVDQLTTGSKTLSEGAHTLADGMVQFNEEGINKILDAYNGDLKPFTDKLQAVIDAGEEYQTYSAIADGQTGSVKFIYKLASIDAKADSDK